MYKIVFTILLISLAILNISCESKSKNKKVNSHNKEVNSQKDISTTGKVVGIVDGDTYDIILSRNETVRIRMEGIDAPEKGMPFYRKAKAYLSGLCFGKNIRLEIQSTDNHGRIVAFSYLDDGTELSHEMIKAGLAWHFKRYNNDSDLSVLEVNAKESKIGLWVDKSPMPPWDNRSLHRNGVSTKDSFDIKEGQQ